MLLPTMVAVVVEMFVNKLPVGVMLEMFGELLPVGGMTVIFVVVAPVGVTKVMFAGAVGPLGVVKFWRVEGLPVGRIVSVLLFKTVVIVVETSVTRPGVGVMFVVFNVDIETGVPVGPAGYDPFKGVDSEVTDASVPVGPTG